MTEKGTNKKCADIWPITFNNDDPISAHIENTYKLLVALQPTHPLHSIVYPILEANLSNPFNLLIYFN